MQKLIDAVQNPDLEHFEVQHEEAFEHLFGGEHDGRYPKRAKDDCTLRVATGKIPFAAYIHPSNPSSGPYGGMSFVVFPPDEEEDGSCLVSMVVGTQGLNPDDQILSRPGHARKMQAITTWINRDHAGSELIAWSKNDPVRIEQDLPEEIQKIFSRYRNSFGKYGGEIYAMCDPTGHERVAEHSIKSFLDVLMDERGHERLSAHKSDAEQIQSNWMDHVFPTVNKTEVKRLLDEQQYVILQGPPGTGKTRMAEQLLNEDYGASNGFSIQFHPNTTYESFVGGLFPEQTQTEMGFQFQPRKGNLLRAIEQAKANPDTPFLLHIDEINRADLARVLGEAIYLFETDAEYQRDIDLPYEFPDMEDGRRIQMPKNLHILGTMNTADESIASLDVAIRRRFSFVDVWPRMSVVEDKGCELMQDAYQDLLQIFLEYAPENRLNLLPGHSYFLEGNEERAVRTLKVTVKPLLEDYLQQGYVSGFAEPIRAYLQWIDGLDENG